MANKIYQAKKERWDDNQPRAYNLVLQHCPPELETRLTTQPKWDTVWMNRDVVSLLEMIRDITHNHDETKLGLMALIEFDMELYLVYQSPTEPCDDDMALFKARVDTINAHDGLSGRYPGYSKEIFTHITEEKEISKETIRNTSPDDRKVLQTDVQ